MKNIFNHSYVTGALALSVIVGFIADYAANSWIYMLGIIIVMVAFIAASIENTKMKKFYKNSTIAIPIVINIDSNKSAEHIFDNLLKDIEQKYGYKELEQNLKKYLNVIRDDLIFTYTGDMYDNARLLSFIQIISYQINKIERNLKNNVIFHLAYYKRPAVGFALGYVFENDEVAIYQKNPDKDQFDQVAQTENRNYKTVVNEYVKFDVSQIKEDTKSDTVLVTIKASSHNIALNSPSLEHYTNVISMHARHNGTISLTEDWVLYAREIFTLLNSLQTKYKSITIAHSMPEALAVLVGMAIGNFWHTKITQFDSGEYNELIEMDKIKCYF